VGFLTDLARASIDSVDALNDVADATGASIENISALADVAARTGTSFETVQTSLLKFNQLLNDAEPDSKTAQALKAIGLSAEALKAVDPAEALRLTAVALSGFADDGDKARLTQELFGKSLKEVAPYLKDLAEQGKLVATVTTEQAEAAEKFKKQLAVLQVNVTTVTRTLSIGLITAINDTVAAFKDGEKAGKSFFAIANDRYWDNVRNAYGIMAESADGYRGRLAEIDKQLTGGESRLLVRNALLREQAELQAKLAAAPIKPADPETQPKPSVGNVVVDDKAAAAAAKAAASAAKRAQDDRMRAGRELATALGKAVEEGNDMYTKMVAEEARLAEADAKRTADYLRNLQAEVTAVADGNQAMALQLQEIGLTTQELGALRLARMDDTVAQLEQTRATAYANGLSYEEVSILEQKIELLKQQRELTASAQIKTAAADSKKDADSASKEFAATLRTDLKGAFSAAFRDSSDNPLKAFGDALENMVFTRAATALTDALIEAATAQVATTSFGKGGGNLLGDLGSLVASFLPSFDGGGSTGSGGRTGGMDGRGGFMALLHPNETVIDHTKGQAGTSGGAVNIYQTINIDSRSDQATIMAAMHRAKEMAKAEILQSRARGGAFA
jgi:hypothetical protein